MLPLSQIIQKSDVFFHFYTDDTQLYLILKPNHQSNLISLMNSSLEEMKYWMTQNVLQLNEGKSEVILFASPDSSKVITKMLDNLSPLVKPHIKNIEVTFDSAFRFDKQVSQLGSTA